VAIQGGTETAQGDVREEQLNFQVKVTKAANETFGTWREGRNDDLVLVIACTAWAAEHAPMGVPGVGVSKSRIRILSHDRPQ
jgi:hypothetical protein